MQHHEPETINSTNLWHKAEDITFTSNKTALTLSKSTFFSPLPQSAEIWLHEMLRNLTGGRARLMYRAVGNATALFLTLAGKKIHLGAIHNLNWLFSCSCFRWDVQTGNSWQALWVPCVWFSQWWPVKIIHSAHKADSNCNPKQVCPKTQLFLSSN